MGRDLYKGERCSILSPHFRPHPIAMYQGAHCLYKVARTGFRVSISHFSLPTTLTWVKNIYNQRTINCELVKNRLLFWLFRIADDNNGQAYHLTGNSSYANFCNHLVSRSAFFDTYLYSWSVIKRMIWLASYTSLLSSCLSLAHPSRSKSMPLSFASLPHQWKELLY